VWRPKCSPSENNTGRVVIPLPQRKPQETRPAKPPAIQAMLAQAEAWQRLLDSGEVRTRAELARRAGATAQRVGQVLALLGLHPAILRAIRALPPGTPRAFASERGLRPVARLPQEKQLRAVERLVPGLLRRREVA
jgi:hypothetical protein